jgi:chromosome partitioning protein
MTTETTPGGLAEQAAQVRLQDLPQFDPPGWRVICVIMQKGGVGKTATTGGLGVHLSDSGIPVVMMDMCHTGALSQSFGLPRVEEEANLANLMTGKWTGSVYDLLVPVRKNLWLVPHAVDMVTVAEDMVSLRYREERLRAALDDPEYGALPERAVVLIDCPPVLNLATDNAALAAAQERGGPKQYGGLLLTPELVKTSLETLDMLMAQVAALSGGGRYAVDTLGWFASEADDTRASNRGRSTMEGLPFQKLGEMPRRTVIKDARDEGKPLLDYRPSSDANGIHAELAKSVRGKLHV